MTAATIDSATSPTASVVIAGGSNSTGESGDSFPRV